MWWLPSDDFIFLCWDVDDNELTPLLLPCPSRSNSISVFELYLTLRSEQYVMGEVNEIPPSKTGITFFEEEKKRLANIAETQFSDNLIKSEDSDHCNKFTDILTL
jgi:hypothetical protein